MTDEREIKELLAKFLGIKEDEIVIIMGKLPGISDMPRLISYRESTSLGSEPEKLIESRMTEVLREKLPEISDMPRLISYRESTSLGSEPEKLIESRMTEVLGEITPKSIQEWFIKMLKEGPPSFFRKPFTKKAQELYKKLI